MEFRRIAFTLLVLVTCALAAPSHAQDKLRLTIANGIAPTIPTHWWFTDFIGPKLAQQSKGRIQANVQVNGTLCSEHKCVEQARLGQIDIGSVSGGNIGSFGQTFDILNLPYIFKDDASAEKLINGWLNRKAGVKSVEAATIEQLEKSIDHLLAELDKTKSKSRPKRAAGAWVR